MPPAKDPDVLNRLKQVYGAMPPHLTPEYKKTERCIKQIKVRQTTTRERVKIIICIVKKGRASC